LEYYYLMRNDRWFIADRLNLTDTETILKQVQDDGMTRVTGDFPGTVGRCPDRHAVPMAIGIISASQVRYGAIETENGS